MSSEALSVRDRALALLSRREHSEKELQQKLQARGLDSGEIAETLQQLKKEGLQSDSRFTESYIRSRELKGYGPRRISQELRERGVSTDLIEIVLEESELDWIALAAEVREKKFGAALPSDYKTQAKQSNFLNYRGFTSEQIRSVINADS